MSGYVATDASAYERSMGRWSRRLAEPFLDALALPAGAAVLDAGCGTGALSEAIVARDPTARIAGIDLSETFIVAAQARVPGGAFRTGDITRLPEADGAFVAALPPERLPRVEALARRACLAGAPDGPRSFVAVARLATGRRAGR